MSAFGSVGAEDDGFQEEEVHETSYEQEGGPSVAGPARSSQLATETVSIDPTSPISQRGTLSGAASAFDDEEDLGSPLAHGILAAHTTQTHGPLTSIKSAFAAEPPPLTINSGPQSQQQLRNNPLAAAGSASILPVSSVAQSAAPATGGPTVSHRSAPLPRIHTSPPTFDDAKASLDALWAQQVESDPALFTHAVYNHTGFFGKADVHVTDPEKRGDGLNSYIIYKVKSSIETSINARAENTVNRRYSDFLWLHEQLFLTPQYAGFLIPPIPDKAVVGRFAEDFVEERRRSLDLFIRRIVAHPVLRESDEVKVFLTGNDQSMAAARRQKMKQVIPGLQPATQSGGVFGFFKDRVHDVTHVFASNRPHDRSPDDVLCEKADDYGLKLQAELDTLNLHLEMLMKREKNVARTWVELGMACGVISQMEAGVNEKINVGVFSTLGSMSDQIAVMLARKVELERMGFRDAVRDQTRLAEAIQQMMKLRAVVSNNYYEALNRLEQLQRKGSGKDPGVHSRLVSEAQALLNQRQNELVDTTNRARVEFGRFQKEKSSALKQAVIHFVRLQIEHAKQSQAAWDNILPEFENLH